MTDEKRDYTLDELEEEAYQESCERMKREAEQEAAERREREERGRLAYIEQHKPIFITVFIMSGLMLLMALQVPPNSFADSIGYFALWAFVSTASALVPMVWRRIKAEWRAAADRRRLGR